MSINPNAWEISESQFPLNGDLTEKLKFLLGYTILAPSSHNVQPWKFKIDNNKINFYVDFTKSLKIANPDNRELFISTGCALFNLTAAAKYFGFNTEVIYSSETDPAAAVIFYPAEPQKDKLFQEITRRHTNRNVYLEKPIAQENLEKLQSCCGGNVVLTLARDKQTKDEIADLVKAGDIIQFNDKAYRNELAYWIKKGILGQTGIGAQITGFIVSHLSLGKSISESEKKLIQTASAFAVLSSEKNERLGWIKTGEAFEQVALTATSLGISLHPMNQGLIQVPENREKLKSTLGITGVPNFAFRLGYAESRTTRRTPRLKLEEFLLS